MKDLKAKLEPSIQLEEGEELISVIFVNESKKLHYSIVCKNVDKISIVESKLFDKKPELKEEEFAFYLNNKRLKRGITLKDNNVKNGDVITLKIIDD